MNENWQEQTKNMVEQGKQMAAGLVAGGEMLVEVDPERGFFKVKLRNVNPPGAVPQLTTGFCWLLENSAKMFNLGFRKYIENQGGKNNG